MATLPPRRNLTPTKISKQHLSPLQILLQMGFPKHRAEKALAATGHRSVQLASDWLLAHVHDLLLDDNSPREYILYACPIGGFLTQLQLFWDKSLELSGWNGALNYMPHITLMSFFKAPDECALNLAQTLKSVMERPGAMLNEPLNLETYTSPNFMGFFVAEEHADHLKRIAMQYVKEVSNDTISLEPHVKSLHLSLAYQFPSSKYSELKSLVDELDPNDSGEWELRLYSRDPRLNKSNGTQVFKVIHPYIPSECDELELRTGDFIYVNSDSLVDSQDGWIEGTSWLTGLTGFLPASFIKRTAETDSWTLHKKVALNYLTQESTGPPYSQYSSVSQSSTLNKDEMELLEIQKNGEVKNGDVEENFEEDVGSLNGHESVSEVAEPQKLFLMRHGERMDFAFGSWIPYCFDESGKYLRKDLNMPLALPERKQGPKGYHKDCPITRVGLYQAQLVGEGIRECNIKIEHVYCSPAFRSLQTCDAFLEGYGKREEIKIRVEPALFEWIVWYPDQFPDWLPTEELAEAGYNVDLDYRPMITREEILESGESVEQFYERSYGLAKQVLEKHRTGNILFMGHATTLEVCSRELLERKICETGPELIDVIRKVSYCALLTLAQDEEGKWQIVDTPCPPVTHTRNDRFDVKIIDRP